jgi:hypothetical protein
MTRHVISRMGHGRSWNRKVRMYGRDQAMRTSAVCVSCFAGQCVAGKRWVFVED